MREFDIVVVGAGSGGITAAVTAAGFRRRVLLVDRDRPGGECTWSGCVPSKALIHEAARVAAARNLGGEIARDTSKALDHVHRVRESVYAHETPEALEASGITYLQGAASFVDRRTIRVGDEEIRAKRIVVSTGSSPFVPPIPGIEEVPYFTNESVFELDRLPESMIVLGGGPIGVELAQAISRLGTRVELVEMLPHILPREEPEFAREIEAQLVQDGVDLNLGATATAVRGEAGRVVLTCQRDGEETTIVAASLLVAIGRRPNVEGLNLEAAGITYDRKGISVDRTLRTSARGIYAIGDVVGPYQFSHMANAQGILATQNAILPFRRKISYDHVAWVTFTDPELARAGLTEAEARKRGQVRVYDVDLNELDRTRTGGPSRGRVKIILDRRGRIVGASILAERAGEMIGEIQVVKSLGIPLRRLAGVVHPYPTYGEVFQKIAKRALVDSILDNPIVRLFRRGGAQ